MAFVTQEEFEFHIDRLEETAIQNFTLRSRGNKSKPIHYLLPISLSDLNTNDVPEPVKAAFEAEESQINMINSDQKLEMEAQVEEFKEKLSVDDFESALDDADDKATEKFSISRRKSSKALKEAGNKFPHARGDILKTRSFVDKGLSSIREDIDQFVGELVGNIAQWVDTAIARIFDSFSGFATSVGSLFGGLFNTSNLGFIKRTVSIVNLGSRDVHLRGIGLNQNFGRNATLDVDILLPSCAKGFLIATYGPHDNNQIFIDNNILPVNMISIHPDCGIQVS